MHSPCKDIAEFINSHNMKVERTANTVKRKIIELERRFKDANDWANQTGIGVLQE